LGFITPTLPLPPKHPEFFLFHVKQHIAPGQSARIESHNLHHRHRSPSS
jgi:hypothetical protein